MIENTLLNLLIIEVIIGHLAGFLALPSAIIIQPSFIPISDWFRGISDSNNYFVTVKENTVKESLTYFGSFLIEIERQ